MVNTHIPVHFCLYKYTNELLTQVNSCATYSAQHSMNNITALSDMTSCLSTHILKKQVLHLRR